MCSICWHFVLRQKIERVITYLSFIDKYGVLTNQWTWLYEALLEVPMTKIALWIRVCADDWAGVCSFCWNLTKIFWVSYFAEFVLGRFSHFYIAIAYSNSKFCGAWTPSFCEFTCNFGKTSTPQKKVQWKLVMTRHKMWSFRVKTWKTTEHKLHKILPNFSKTSTPQDFNFCIL